MHLVLVPLYYCVSHAIHIKFYREKKSSAISGPAFCIVRKITLLGFRICIHNAYAKHLVAATNITFLLQSLRPHQTSLNKIHKCVHTCLLSSKDEHENK